MESRKLPVELWADESIASDRLRQRLIDEGIEFREVAVDGSSLPALRVDGAIYDSHQDINMAVEWLHAAHHKLAVNHAD